MLLDWNRNIMVHTWFLFCKVWADFNMWKRPTLITSMQLRSAATWYRPCSRDDDSLECWHLLLTVTASPRNARMQFDVGATRISHVCVLWEARWLLAAPSAGLKLHKSKQRRRCFSIELLALWFHHVLAAWFDESSSRSGSWSWMQNGRLIQNFTPWSVKRTL